MTKSEKNVLNVNTSLLNVITPMGLEFSRNGLIIGEQAAKLYGVIQYPPKANVGWLSPLTNLPSTMVSIGFQPIDNSALITAISKSITQNRSAADSAKDPLTRQRAEKAATDGENIMLQIDQNGETVGLMNVTVMPFANDDKLFARTCRRVENTFSLMRCKIRTLAHLQKDSLRHLSPMYPSQNTIENILNRIMPMSTFVGGFPFASSGFNDGSGYYLAKDASGGLIIIDPWKRGGDRTNSNMVVMGVAGVGKSTAVKHIALSEYMKGTKVIFIDPESEYKELCQQLGGDWINAGGGSNGRINPLQIRPAPRDEEGEEHPLYKDEGNGMSDMALHLKNLEIFFNLYIPDLNMMQKAVLKQCIIELYNQFHIHWSTDIAKLQSIDFPTFTDLYELIKHKEQALDDEIYKALALLLYDIAHGGDSFLWNGHSTIQTRSRCICLDTHSLQNTSDNIKRTQYFNLLSWCWEQMSQDRTERVLLICDETYLMIDPQVPQSLVFLRNVEKRARKYEAALAIISHSVVDFLAPEIKMYGQALLDIPCLKVLMGTDGKNLQETRELYNLTDAEEELLASKKREHALLMIGSKRIHAHFEIPDYKFAYMGSAGGR
ncbi:VirB4 family type IV secretion system protein [Paenibacillus sp. FSL L8-0506]|uniref:VirB4 family type IV secretion system protein n=1 Tax=Paenibacillus sp. FSL L8-0506 TaxID=2975335 RepID=UPI0030F7B85C